MTLSGSGILAYGAYLPFHRLDRSEIPAVAGSGGGTGTRTVASYDEDTTTMAVEAARAVLVALTPSSRTERDQKVGSLWFATTSPAYVDKTNATAIHAALGLDAGVPAFDVNGAVRSAMGALRAGLGAAGPGTPPGLVDPPAVGQSPRGRGPWRAGIGPALVVASDVRTGLPGSTDEAAGGDGAAALLVGPGGVGAAGLDADGAGDVGAGGLDADGAGGIRAHGDAEGEGAGSGEPAPLLAEVVGWGSATAEFLDRWRAPGDLRSKVWEERFGEGRYVEAGERAWREALAAGGVAPGDVDHLVVVSSHARAASSFRRSVVPSIRPARRTQPGEGDGHRSTDIGGEGRNGPVELDATVGFTGAAHPFLALAATLDGVEPGALVALVTLADGADVVLLRTTDALTGWRRHGVTADTVVDAGAAGAVDVGAPGAVDVGAADTVVDAGAAGATGIAGDAAVDAGGPGRASRAEGSRTCRSSVAAQVAGGGPVSYGRYLAWRGILPVEPPRRPEPARPSASAAGRSASWKFGLLGSEATDGTVHLPPSPLDAHDRPMADATGTIATFTVDRMAYSPSPPVVFAVVDFDGGGRLPVELTDVDPTTVQIGDRVEMTFRRLFTADGIHNYFWKARPISPARVTAELAPDGSPDPASGAGSSEDGT